MGKGGILAVELTTAGPAEDHAYVKLPRPGVAPFAILVLLAALPACSGPTWRKRSPASAASGPNRTCPVTGERIEDEVVIVEYQGQHIRFSRTQAANQFLSLSPVEQERIISRWRVTELSLATAP